MKMKKKSLQSLFLIILLENFLFFSEACKKETAKEVAPALPQTTEVDVQKIESATGLHFSILKTDAIGYAPLHKFYWVCLYDKQEREKVEMLASQIIKETITGKPKTYHSFTIHFIYKEDLAEAVEKSKAFAHAYFLPEGSWSKVGRVPIDGYKDYKLTCTFVD